MSFACISPDECRAKYRRADDKYYMIGVIADLTASNRKSVEKFLGVEAGVSHIDGEKALALYRSGMDDRNIAAAFGVTSCAVSVWRKKNGLPSVHSKGRIPEEKCELLYKQGYNDIEIGKALGISQSGVYSWRKRNKLPPNVARGGRRNKSEVNNDAV